MVRFIKVFFFHQQTRDTQGMTHLTLLRHENETALFGKKKPLVERLEWTLTERHMTDSWKRKENLIEEQTEKSYKTIRRF